MTQIALTSGTPASVSMLAGSRLNIAGTGVYRIGPLGLSQRPTVDELIDNFVTVGPFADSCVVQIWAGSTGATYELVYPTDVLDQTGRPYQSGMQVLLNSAPNLTLNDTSGGAGTTATPFGISCTVRGGVMGSSSMVRIYALIDWVGGNSKNTILKIGPASGNWGSATQVSGQSGLTNQINTPVAAIVGNDNTLVQQRSSPANVTTWFGTSTAFNATVTTIDTSLDWTIYCGIQFSVLNGGNTATLRRFVVELLP